MTSKVDEWIFENDNGRIPGTAIFERQTKEETRNISEKEQLENQERMMSHQLKEERV